VANDLEVRLPTIDERPNPDIARDAIAAITRTRRVRGANMIAVKPRAKPTKIWKKIHEALKLDAEVDANRALVETNDSKVILSGPVRSWLERHEAERAAWSAPGVTRVEDRIVAHPWPPRGRRTCRSFSCDLFDGGQRSLGF
jgi:hypothetical protein